jgi:phosphatidylglycerophosphatase A
VRRPVVALSIATAFGVGYIPFAPGTFGSAVGLVVWAALPSSIAAHLVAILLMFAIGAWCGTVAERHFGGTDPGPVVIDEVMGMLLTLFMHPVGWGGAMAAFLLFRAFDVLKPYPADRLERLPGGLGVMADDGMAAIYANLVLWGILSAIAWLS